jgi:two-component system sensor histidine kinase HupT/HoxJ
VFEPFFTQGKAEGTGLGLYVSHGIVERHGGELLAGNATDGGAVFTLRLPLTRTDSTEMVA